MRRGLTIYLRLSHGRLEAGPGGGPASWLLERSPFRVRRGNPTHLSMRLRDRPPGPQRRTGRAKYGAADGPPFLLPSPCPLLDMSFTSYSDSVFAPGEVVSYFEMCREEESSLQRGMNYQLRGGDSVVLMSRRPGARYADRVEDEGRVLIYEGHDSVRRIGERDPKSRDQPLITDTGGPTQNAQFFSAAKRHATTGVPPSGSVSMRSCARASGSSTASFDSWTPGRRRATAARSSSSGSCSIPKHQGLRLTRGQPWGRRA